MATEGRTKGVENRWFSDSLGPSFASGMQRELLEFLCGDRLGSGMSREVFRFLPHLGYVLKIESIEHRFQNIEEYRTWQEVEDTPYAKWFAPCHAISGCGRFLLQHYADPIAATNLPAEVPAFFVDLKPANWGTLAGRPVCVDYGRTRLMQTGLSSRKRKADWT